MIYLDNAATTYPLLDCVCDEMDRVNRSLSVNAGRGSYKAAVQASKIIDSARENLAGLAGAATDRIIFSASATLAANQVLYARNFSSDDVVYVSPYEHNAVLRPLHALQQRFGFEIVELPIDKESLEIDLSMMKDMFGINCPSLVCCTHVSNVTGYILPVKTIAEIAKGFGADVLVDASQSAGLLKIDMINIDYLIFAGHKTLYGPFGVGGIVLGPGAKLNAFLAGGTGSDSLNLNMPEYAPAKYEPGSMNISAIAGLNAALNYIKQVGVEVIAFHEKELTMRLISGLSEITGVKMYLPGRMQNHIGIVSFNVEGYTSQECGQILDNDFDIAVRTGYHCAALVHKHLRDREYLGTVRASVGWFTKEEDIEGIVEAVKEVAEE